MSSGWRYEVCGRHGWRAREGVNCGGGGGGGRGGGEGLRNTMPMQVLN